MIPFPRLIRWIPAVFLLSAIAVGVQMFCVIKDTRPSAWDQAIHTKNALDYQERFSQENWLQALRPNTFRYPPLYHIAMIPFVNHVADVADAGAFLNSFFLVVLIFVVFFIGNHMMGPWEGFTAAVLIAAFPIIVALSRTTLIDLSLTALVALAFLCLLRSEDFSFTLWSLAFGFTLGIAMLTKWSAAIYLAVPFLWVAWRGWKRFNTRRILLALGLCVIVMAPWYGQNFFPMVAQLFQVSGMTPASEQNLSGLANVFWYPLSLSEQMGLVSVVFLLLGLVATFWRPRLGLLVAWLISSMILFSLIHNKNTRYLAPALPAGALLCAAWLPPARRVPHFFVWGLAAVYLSLYSFVPNLKAGIQLGSQWQPILESDPPRAENWDHKGLIEKVHRFKQPDQAVTNVLVLSNHAFLHSTTLQLSARVQGVADVTFHGPSKRRPFEFRDFVLFKSGHIGPALSLGSFLPCVEVVTKPEPWFPLVFKEVDRWKLPDESEAVLFKTDPTPQKVDAGSFNLSLEELVLPHVRALGVKIHVVPISAAETKVGRFQEMVIRSQTAEYKKIGFENVEIQLIEPQINVPLYLQTGEIQLLHLKAMRPRAVISERTLVDYAAKKAKWFKSPSVTFEGSTIRMAGKAGIIPLRIDMDVTVSENALRTNLRHLRLAGIPIPTIFFRALTNRTLPLLRNKNWTYDILIDEIRGTGQTLQIGRRIEI